MITAIATFSILYILAAILVYFNNIRDVRKRIGKVYSSQYFWNGLVALFWLPIGVYLLYYALYAYRK